MAQLKTPVRYPSSIATDAPGTTMQDFPMVPNKDQFSMQVPALPYRGTTDFTVTTAGSATAQAVAGLGGTVSLTTTNLANDAVTLVWKPQALQIIPGNRSWLAANIAGSTTVAPAITANIFLGWLNASTFAAATAGVYLQKAAASTALNLVIKNGGTTTTFTNVADLAKPSGIYGDTTSSVGSLAFNTTGTTFTNVTVATPGAGYARAPIIKATGTGGSAAQVYCQLGSGSLYAPYITAAGSGYTANTLGAEVNHVINLSMFYDGKGTLFFGINGKTVLSIGPKGATSVTAGATVANASFNSYTVTNQLSTGVAPVQPATGAFENIAPLVPMFAGAGIVNPAASFAAATAYLQNFEVAGDIL